MIKTRADCSLAWNRCLPWKLEQGYSNTRGVVRLPEPDGNRYEETPTNRESAPVPGKRRRAGIQYKSHTGRAELRRANRVLGPGENDTSNVTSLNKRGHPLRRYAMYVPHSTQHVTLLCNWQVALA